MASPSNPHASRSSRSLSGAMCTICTARACTPGWRGLHELERCRACGHVTRMPVADRWLRQRAWGGDARLDRVRLALTARRLRRQAPCAPGDAVLDVGFGRGELLARYQRRGCRVTGIDPGWLGQALDPTLRRDRVQLRAGVVESELHDLHAYHLVYAIHVLEHVDSPSAAMHRIASALRPGGRFYALTPDADSLGLALFRRSWWNMEDPTHIRFFSETSLRRLIEDAGLRCIRVGRPLMDSLMMEPLSVLRAVRGGAGRRHGVLASRANIFAAALLAPAALAARVLVPRLRPTLEIIAERP